MRSHRLTRFPLLALAGLALSLPALAQAPAPEPRPETTEGSIGDTVNVEIKIVPFYAVDEQGKPVLDLKPEEIELQIDGKPVPVDTFDAFPQVGGATAIDNAGSPEPSAAPGPAAAKGAPVKAARRHVVIFFDVAFSNLRGFDNGREFAEKMVREAPETDLLYLVTSDFKSGLKQRLGPVAATEKGKSQVLADLRRLKPEAGLLDQEAAYGSLPLVDRGASKNGVPRSQNSALYMAVRTNSDAQVEAHAVRLAESFQVLAEQFQRIQEPKLMVFLSQGINNRLYFEGSDIALQFSTAPFAHINNKQFRGLHTMYEKPLQDLSETGTMSLFVNLDDKRHGAGSADSSMQHMARMSSGLYVGEVDPAVANARAANSTGAYYEAGFYLGDAGIRPARAKVDVRVKRPGVRTWSAGTIKTRETWRGLSEDARRLLIVDLVEGDAEATRARSSVRLDLHNLPGNVLGRSNEGKTMLRYQVGWPQELAGRKIDLYNIVLEPTRQAGSPKILRFDKEGTRVDGTPRNIDVEVPEKATFVWGIVAVEPATGKTWYRRFHLQGKQP